MEIQYGGFRARCVSELPGGLIKDNLLRPEDIDTSRTQVGSFGKCEVEEAAANLVRFFQMRGGWVNFSLPELIEFSKLNEFDSCQVLFGLLGYWYDDGLGAISEAPPYLVALPGGSYCPTELFIDCCKSSAKINQHNG